jgi:hypothetical protein
MFRRSTKSAGFAAPLHEDARHQSPLPVLIAIVALAVSIAIVLTASASRAAQLF